MSKENVKHWFATTHWSVVLRAQSGDGADVDSALATLCETYWPPLYAYARRLGKSHGEAQDLTQGFLAGLLQRRGMDSADPEKGRFRCFLGISFQRYIQSDWTHSHAAKRGGTRPIVNLDAMSEGESEELLSASGGLPATEVLDAHWATQVFLETLGRVERRYVRNGNAQVFRELRGYLDGSKGPADHREVGGRLGMGTGAVATAVCRLIGRFRETLREVVLETLGDGESVEEEMEYLARCLRRR